MTSDRNNMVEIRAYKKLFLYHGNIEMKIRYVHFKVNYSILFFEFKYLYHNINIRCIQNNLKIKPSRKVY